MFWITGKMHSKDSKCANVSENSTWAESGNVTQCRHSWVTGGRGTKHRSSILIFGAFVWLTQQEQPGRGGTLSALLGCTFPGICVFDLCGVISASIQSPGGNQIHCKEPAPLGLCHWEGHCGEFMYDNCTPCATNCCTPVSLKRQGVSLTIVVVLAHHWWH